MQVAGIGGRADLGQHKLDSGGQLPRRMEVSREEGHMPLQKVGTRGSES